MNMQHGAAGHTRLLARLKGLSQAGFFPSIDDCHSRLKSLGWSVGDACIVENGQRFWQVFCQKGDQKVVARAGSQTEAWRAAVGLAEKQG
jgi:hypothetical protein